MRVCASFCDARLGHLFFCEFKVFALGFPVDGVHMVEMQVKVKVNDHGNGYTRRTGHDLDHHDPNPPLGDVAQDLYSTDPTQEICPRSCRFYGSHPAAWTR